MRVTSAIPRIDTVDQLIDARLAARLDRLDVRSTKLFPGKLMGERRSKRRGQSVEFDDFRPYVAGDDLRFIDWNAYARLDKLIIKLFLEEEDLAVHIALDASASMRAGSGDETKILYGARLAMALGYIGLVNQNRVGMSVFGAPASKDENQRAINHLPEMRGRNRTKNMGQFLLDTIFDEDASSLPAGASALAPMPGGDFNSALTSIARTRSGRGVLILISDFLIDSGYEKGLRALATVGGYDIYCIQTLAPSELEPERETQDGIAGDLRLTDAETGRTAEVTMTPQLIQRYKQRLETYCEGLRTFCLARGMAHMLIRTDTPMDELVFDTLRRRGVVG